MSISQGREDKGAHASRVQHSPSLWPATSSVDSKRKPRTPVAVFPLRSTSFLGRGNHRVHG